MLSRGELDEPSDVSHVAQFLVYLLAVCVGGVLGFWDLWYPHDPLGAVVAVAMLAAFNSPALAVSAVMKVRPKAVVVGALVYAAFAFVTGEYIASDESSTAALNLFGVPLISIPPAAIVLVINRAACRTG